jgi:hypothetical protein
MAQATCSFSPKVSSTLLRTGGGMLSPGAEDSIEK